MGHIMFQPLLPFSFFLPRCNDLLELVQTTRHFNLLQMAAEVGGAGTKSLDALVREIHEEFSCAMEDFGKHVADILDITASQAFEKAFFIFRSIVKVWCVLTFLDTIMDGRYGKGSQVCGVSNKGKVWDIDQSGI